MVAPNPRATDRPRKAVLVGGECDGLVVRLNFDPPERLVVLVDEPATRASAYADAPAVPLPVVEAFVAPVNAFPNATPGRPVPYVRWSMTGLPVPTRVTLYVPAPTEGVTP